MHCMSVATIILLPKNNHDAQKREQGGSAIYYFISYDLCKDGK